MFCTIETLGDLVMDRKKYSTKKVLKILKFVLSDMKAEKVFPACSATGDPPSTISQHDLLKNLAADQVNRNINTVINHIDNLLFTLK